MPSRKQKRIPLQRTIWCRIRYFQMLNGITEDTLADTLKVKRRTLKEYDKNPENITLGKIDNFLFVNNISLKELFE